MKEQQLITPAIIENAMSYESYRNIIDELFTENRATGDFLDNSEEALGYTKLNIARMNRGDKKCKINEELSALLKSISEQWIWIVITEGWCGDAAQSLPALVKMANLNSNIQLKFIFRHEHPEVMDAYLTNGSRAIPKLIALKASDLTELGVWGARPEEAQNIVVQNKKAGISSKEYNQILHKWYAKDKYVSIQKELFKLIESWKLSL